MRDTGRAVNAGETRGLHCIRLMDAIAAAVKVDCGLEIADLGAEGNSSKQARNGDHIWADGLVDITLDAEKQLRRSTRPLIRVTHITLNGASCSRPTSACERD